MPKPRSQLRGRNSRVAEPLSAETGRRKLNRNEAARERWSKAAKQFKGLGVRLQAKNQLRHITRTPNGYVVRIIRGRKPAFERYVAGFSEQSLLKAMRLRDDGVGKLDRDRLHPIPTWVLRELGLAEPVVGICRLTSRYAYRASYRTPDGRKHGRSFYYRRVPETVAYAAAITFLHQTLELKARGKL